MHDVHETGTHMPGGDTDTPTTGAHAPAAGVEVAPGVRFRAKKYEFQLPHKKEASLPQSDAEMLGDYQKWKAEFMQELERGLRRINPEIHVIDFRLLKHWDLSFFQQGDQKPPQLAKEDEMWTKAMRRLFIKDPSMEQTVRQSDDDDFVVLVDFRGPKNNAVGSGSGDLEVLVIRRAHPTSLRT